MKMENVEGVTITFNDGTEKTFTERIVAEYHKTDDGPKGVPHTPNIEWIDIRINLGERSGSR